MFSCEIAVVGGVTLLVYFGQQLRIIKSKRRSSNDDGKMLTRYVQLVMSPWWPVYISLHWKVWFHAFTSFHNYFFDVNDESLEGFHYQLWHTMAGVLYPILTVILFQWRFICIFKNLIYQVGKMMNICGHFFQIVIKSLIFCLF